jgi:CRISPR system Cascade subunit CasD
MSVLLLRLAGPMQSWGTQSRFTMRDTGLEPSKSGVNGLLCAALGLPRSHSVDHLGKLRMGVRVDREGVVQMDYHTAGGSHRRGHAYGVVRADGGAGGTVVSRRYYLADADFLVALEGTDSLLAELDLALAHPVWQLFLGRKSFVPGVPVRIHDGLRRGAILPEALVDYPWPRPDVPVPPPERRPQGLRLVLETDAVDGAEVRRDQPVGAAFQDRTFANRLVVTTFRRLGDEVPVRRDSADAGACQEGQ